MAAKIAAAASFLGIGDVAIEIAGYKSIVDFPSEKAQDAVLVYIYFEDW